MEKNEIIEKLTEVRSLVDECLESLDASPSVKSTDSKKKGLPKNKTNTSKLDFSLPARGFIKTYATGMNGEKKFTLLLAYKSEGKTEVNVTTSEIVALWETMKAKDLLGGYNTKYPTAAKTNSWIDSKERGSYFLRSTWKEIFD